MARVVGFFILMALAALLAYWLLAPHLLHMSSTKPNSPSFTTRVPNSPSVPSAQSAPQEPTSSAQPPNIPPPLSAEQKSDIIRENLRAPYYDWLCTSSQGFVQQAYADTDRTILVVQLTAASPQALTELFNKAIVPYASRYGFLHVRFYTPLPQGSPADRQLYAEAAFTNNTWQLFFR